MSDDPNIIDDEDFEDEIEDFEDEDEEGSTKSTKKRKVATPAIKPHPPIPKLPYSDRVFIIQQPSNTTTTEQQPSSNDHFEILTLPNPKYESIKCRYIIDKTNNRTLEINKFNSKPSCLFIDNGARNDGSIYLSSDIDPLFLLIPFLEKNKEQNKNEYFEISSIINDPYFSNISKVPFKHDQVSLICDSKEIADTKLYRLDDDKLLVWLRCKVKNISNYLKETDTDIFKTSNHVKRELSWETLYTMSIGFISEYLSEKHCEMLNKSFDLLSTNAKQTIKQESQHLIYTERIEPEPSKPKKAAGKKASAKKQASPANPQNSISNYFTSSSSTTKSDPSSNTKKISDFFTKK